MPSYDTVQFQPPAAIAEVTLRDTLTAATFPGVQLLLDTGADITLLPKRAVEQLGVRLEEGAVYELVGFDGNRQMAAAASLDVLFQGKIYRGRYAITDSDIGVLGRDVLNHVALVIHGPKQEWFEYR